MRGTLCGTSSVKNHMSKRIVIFSQGNIYHLYNRGAKRQPIFRTKENYLFLMRRMRQYTMDFSISVIAYCLMPNHFHFVFRQNTQHSISDCMHRIFNSYSKAFNKRYNLSGTLFEERFKAKLVDLNEYLVHLCRYVHRNPLEARLVDEVSEWEYSNYLEWIGKRSGEMVDFEIVKTLFPQPGQYEEFVKQYSGKTPVTFDC